MNNKLITRTLQICEGIIKSGDFGYFGNNRWTIHYIKASCHTKMGHTLVALSEVLIAMDYRKNEQVIEDLFKNVKKEMENIQVNVINGKICQDLLGLDNNNWETNAINKIVFPVLKYFKSFTDTSEVFNNVNHIIREFETCKKKQMKG